MILKPLQGFFMDDVIKCLKDNGFSDFKNVTKNRINVLTDLNRLKCIKSIEKIIQGTHNTNPNVGSSLGCVQTKDGRKIIVKDINKQGNKSPGISNEIIFYSKVKEALKTCNKISIMSDKRIIEYFDVLDIEMVSKNFKNRKKADIKIITKNGDFLISLKKDNSEFWESAESFIKDEAKNIIKKALDNNQTSIKKIDNGIYKIEKFLSWKATKTQAQNVVFGSDMKQYDRVIIKSFYDEDFSIIENTLHINVNHIISDIRDLTEKQEVHFLIRNDKTRTAGTLGYPGLRVIAVTKSRLRGENIVRF